MQVITIAELGINHGGDMDTAIAMMHRAALCQADIVKFQHYDPVTILGQDNPFLGEAAKAQFSKSQLEDLKACADGLGVEWGVSLFHAADVAWTEKLGMVRYKVASRAALDHDLLREINRTEKPVVMSTGLLDTPGKLEEALNALRDCDVTLLHCVTRYPTPLAESKVSEMPRLRHYCRKFGLSSHCPAIEPSLLAVGLGAVVLENHVALDPKAPGCDMASSLSFQDFSRMVGIVKNMELCR